MSEETRHVAINAVAVDRAKRYAEEVRAKTGESLPIKTVFAKALDVMIKTESGTNDKT